MSTYSGSIHGRVIAETRVAVQDPSRQDPELGRVVLGTATHEGRLLGVLWSVTVRFDSGAVRQVPPAWVRPALDLAALLHLPPSLGPAA